MSWMSCCTTPFLEDEDKNQKALFFTRAALISIAVLALLVFGGFMISSHPVHAADSNQLQGDDPFTVLTNFINTVTEKTNGVVTGLVTIFATFAIFSIISGAKNPQSKSMAISWLMWVLGGYIIYKLLPVILNFVSNNLH